jgi:hypothetical protein
MKMLKYAATCSYQLKNYSRRMRMDKEHVYYILTIIIKMKMICAKMTGKKKLAAPDNNAVSGRQYEIKKNVFFLMEHPPYSPNLDLCDIFLFQVIKSSIKGMHLGSLEDVQQCTSHMLKVTSEYAFRNVSKCGRKEQLHVQLPKGPILKGTTDFTYLLNNVISWNFVVTPHTRLTDNKRPDK